MEGRSPEISIEVPQDSVEKTDGGFSEKRAARILEGKQQDNSQVKKQKPIRLRAGESAVSSVPQKDRLLALHKEIAESVLNLLASLTALSERSMRQEEQLINEIHTKQKLQQEIVHAIVLHQKGELNESALSKELRDLIK